MIRSHFIIPQIKVLIQKAFEKSDLNGLKLVSADLNESIKSLPPKDIKEIEEILEEQFGWDGLSLAEYVATIKTRGFIESDQEFHDINNFINELINQDNNQNEEKITKLNKLLMEYEQSK